ncbi:uncharacterized protein LOC133640784 [Entelurus aequoreus]|uniref:uncharacterized protein LOC133640784 n=1 Tax=Entelurus aequoreus TaxID=161455 RepID=UPI002B1D00A1|nr:uncharacterized protein LOC133640784 [Entelurus aequoreus]
MPVYDVTLMQTQHGQSEQPMWMQVQHLQSHSSYPQAQQYPSPEHVNVRAQIPQQLQQTNVVYPPQPHLQPRLQAQSQPHIQTQAHMQPQFPLAQLNPQFPPQFRSIVPTPSQPQTQSLSQCMPEPQLAQQSKVQPSLQPKPQFLPLYKPELQLVHQAIVQPTTQTNAKSVPQCKPEPQIAQSLPEYIPESQLAHQAKYVSPTQSSVGSMPQPSPELQSPQLKIQSPIKPATQLQQKVQKSPEPMSHLQPQPPIQSAPQFTQKPTHSIIHSQVCVLPHSQAESPDLCLTPPVLSQAPPQAYSEAYAKAQALARNGFEEAKHCLQGHILEAITIFKDKCIPDGQASATDTLKTLDPELLEEFLRAAKGMEAFCTPSQLKDMETFTQSVRSQWESCFSAECRLQAGNHLETLKELCDMLSPEDAHRLAHTQLRECESSLAAIQRQFSGDQEALLPDSRIPVVFNDDQTPQKETESVNPSISTEASQMKIMTASVEQKPVKKQPPVVEEVIKKEALERYDNCKKSLQVQLSKNEQSISDVPSDSGTLKGLHTRLQEIQFLRQETTSLWSEFANQCSHLSEDAGLEQEISELEDQWRAQQSNLQRRGSSLGAALRQIDSTENHMVDFSDRLDRYLRQPKDITAFTLANTNILKDIKELDENIQSELDQLSRLEPESSNLDPRDCLPLSREVEAHRNSLDQLRQQVRKSEAAARALDRFLVSLRTLEEDIAGVQGAPCSDTVALQDCRAKLAVIKQSVGSLKDKAPQLDLLLQGARLTVTKDGSPASCLDMVNVLLKKLGEADSGLVGQQQSHKKGNQSKSLGLRKRTLLGEVRKLQDTIETRGLTEASMPAVQQRLRALSDLDDQRQTLNSELQILRDLPECQGEGQNPLEELDTLYKQTETSLTDRKQQCSILMELLKKFQSCRSGLSNTMQRAEQTISEQASYLGKDNLQRIITKVQDIKKELSGLGEPMDEFRGVSKQLQSTLKKFPDCREAPFETEADILMDNWLDMTEKTDSYMDNLKVGLELWEKQLMLGGEIDGWVATKLALFAESHPFHKQEQVVAMKEEVQAHEENIDNFHKKSEEIQEMLQSQDAPLELQVMETQLRKRMEQVKELFADCTDVFEELMMVKTHFAEKIAECLSALGNIHCSISELHASEPKAETQMQDLEAGLEDQERQAESVLKEIALVSSVASPQVLETLSADCEGLTAAIARAKDIIHLKREEREKGFLTVIEDERQSFEDWYQDLQLAVYECFEDPESRLDVETSLQRLTGFLKTNAAEQRLDQLKDHLDIGRQQIDAQRLTELDNWLKDEREEVLRFTRHCLIRQKQIECLHADLCGLQTHHDSLHEWLQDKENQSTTPVKAKHLLKDLQDERQRADAVIELLASVSRQGVKADPLVKDSDDLIRRYRKLEARLQTQAEAHDILEGELEQFMSQSERTKGWFKDLLQPFTLADGDKQCKEMSHQAKALLSTKPEGDSKVNQLRCLSQSLCEQEQLEQSKKQQVQQSLQDVEDEWQAVLQAAEDTLNKSEKQACLHQEMDAFRVQSDSLQSWISDSAEDIQSPGGCTDEKQHDILLIKTDLGSKLQNLKEQGESLCNSVDLDEGFRKEIQDTIRLREEQWQTVTKAAEEMETAAACDKDVAALRSRIKATQSWIREQRHKLLSLGSHMLLQERLQVTQAVMASEHEGQSKVLDLKKEEENLDTSRRPEVTQLVLDLEQQWRSVLQTCKEAELRGFADDFETQSKTTQSWVREQEKKLQSVSVHAPPEERCRTIQDVLQSKPDGDCQVNNLRRRGQSLCDRQDVEEGRKCQVQQTVQDTEEQWREVLQVARKLREDIGAQMNQEMERRVLELTEFKSLHQETNHWLSDLQQQLDSLTSQSTEQGRLHAALTIMGCKSEGDIKLQEMKRRYQSLCAEELEQHQKADLERIARDTQDQWTAVLESAKATLNVLEKQSALKCQLRKHKEAREEVQTWLEEQQLSLNCHKDHEVTITTAQAILSSKPNRDSELAELKRQSHSLCDHEDVEDAVKRESQQAVRDLEEQWRTLLHDAENSLKKAEVLYSLSRELQAFFSQAASTDTWLEELQAQLETTGTDTLGSQVQIEDRLNTAQTILNSKSSGETRVMELQRRVQNLYEHEDLEEDSRLEVQTKLKKVEEQWRTIMQAADERSRLLQTVVGNQVSCRYQQGQVRSRFEELQTQISSLPRDFSWPGLGERRQAMEQARSLLDRSAALGPLLSGLRTKAAELCETTQDPEWADSTWGSIEESIPILLKQLTEALANLERGIMAERQCTQLLEQHEAAQDWLREQVKALKAPPDDRKGLHSAINTLKALLQTVDREQREMKELDAARDDLLSVCTPGGRDALTLEVSHLHELCATSEHDVKDHLGACEARLRDLECQAAQKTKALTEKATALQWELRSLDQALGYSEPQDNVEQIQQHWHSLQNCKKSLEEIRGKVDQLQEEVRSANELPIEITTSVDSLRQQHDSLQTRLREHQQSCSTNAARCLTNSIQALQEWTHNHNKPSESIATVQEAADEGEKMQAILQEALSHHQFLSDCLKQDVFDKLSKDSSETLRQAGTLQMSLCHNLKELMKRSDQKTDDQPMDIDVHSEEKKTSLVAPPRKNKKSIRKKSQDGFQQDIPSTDTSGLDQDDLSVSSRSSEQTDDTDSGKNKEIPTRKKSKTKQVSLDRLSTGEIVHVETKKTEHESKKTSVRGQDEAMVMDERKTTSAATLYTNDVPQAKEGTEKLHGATTLELVSVSSTESKEPSQSKEPLPTEESTQISDAAFVEAKITSNRKSTLLEDRELGVCNDSNLDKARKDSESGEASAVAQLVTGIIEAAMKDIALPSKKDQVELEHTKTSSASQAVTGTPEVDIAKAGKISPPKRKSKSSKVSQGQPKTKEQIVTKEELYLKPKEKKLVGVEELGVCDDSNLQKATEDSKSVEASVVAQLVTGIIEAAMKDIGLPSNNVQIELESTNTSSTSKVFTGIPEVIIGEEEKIPPPKTILKSSKISPELPKREEHILTNKDFYLEPKQEKLVDVKKPNVCDDSNLNKAGKDSESGEASVVAQFVTGIIEAAMKDIALPSKEDPTELGCTKTSSASQVIRGIPEGIAEEGKISPSKRKSKISPELPKREEHILTEDKFYLEPKEEKLVEDQELSVCNDSNIHKATKDYESEEASAVAQLVTGIIEAAIMEHGIPSKKDEMELDSRKTFSVSQVVTEIPKVIAEEGKISPPTRKSTDRKLSPKLPSKEMIVPTQTSFESSVKREEAVTPLPVYAVGDTDDDKVNQDYESGKNTSEAHAVTTTLEASPEDERKISPSKRNSKRSTAFPGLPKKMEEKSDSHRPCSNTGNAETTVFEESKLKNEAETEQKSSDSIETSENNITEVISDLPIERQAKHFDDSNSVVDKDTCFQPEEGEQVDTLVKASKTKDNVVGKISPPKRKQKSGKVSSETPKLPTRRKSKNHDVSKEPVTDVSEGFETKTGDSRQGPESEGKSSVELLVKSKPDAAVLEDRKLSPPKRKLKGLKASTDDMHDAIKSLPEDTVGLEVKNKDIATADVKAETKSDENTSELHANAAENDGTILPPFARTGEAFTEMILIDQTMTAMQTVIELELLETREIPEEVKDNNVQVQISNDDATTSLENPSVLLESIQGRAGVDMLEVNIQSQVEDGQLSVMSSAEQQVIQSESGQSSSVVLTKLQPNKTELIEIILFDPAMEKKCQTDSQVEPSETSQETYIETVEQTAAISANRMQDTALTIHIGPEVHVLKVDVTACQEEQENTLETGPTNEIVQSNIQCERPAENKDTSDKSLPKTALEELPKIQQIVIESHSAQLPNVDSEEKSCQAETDTGGSTQEVQARTSSSTEVEMASKNKTHEGEKDKPPTEMSPVEKQEVSRKRHDDEVQSESIKAISVAFEPVQPLESGNNKDYVELIQDKDQSQLCAESLGQEELQIGVGQEMASPHESSSDIQPIMSLIKMTEAEVSEFAEPPLHSDLDTVPDTQTAEQVDNPVSSTAQNDIGKVVRFGPQNITHTDTPTSNSEPNEAISENLNVDALENSPLTDIFSEIKMVTDAGLLKEVEACENPLAELMTSSSDLDDRRCRLVLKLLSCKSHSPELQPTVMMQQVKEAQECQDMAQDQVSLLCQQRDVPAENSDTLEFVEDQWRAVAQDAAAVVESKEAHLQLVHNFCQITQETKTTLERLATELDAVRNSLAESSHKKADQLNSIKRDIEENRSVLGKLLGIHTKLYPLLSCSNQATAKIQLQTLHHEWREMETVLEKALHHTDIQSQKASSLLLELSYLRGHLESIGEELEAKYPSSQVCQWDHKKAQQFLMAHAEVKAANVKYLHLKERSESLLLSLWPKETAEINKGLLNVKDQVCLSEEWMSSQIQKSSNPIMEQVMTVARDGLTWAKQIESDLDGRRKTVPLHPEAVHQQLRDLKRLQSEVTIKHSQLKIQVKEVAGYLPQLDPAEEIPVVHSLLDYLKECSKSITEKLSKAMKDTESGLQIREKLFEQIADLDTWVGTHLQRVTAKSIGGECMCPAEIDYSEIQETLVEAKTQSALCNALLNKSKDICSELSITENCQLFDKIKDLQKDIDMISSYEKSNKNELEEHMQSLESNKQQLATIEKNLREMQVDLGKFRFPITIESLQVLEPFNQLLLEQKSQIDILQSRIPPEKTIELYSGTAAIHNLMTSLQMKARNHERYLNLRQRAEDIKEAIEEQVNQTNEESREVAEKYKICQKLIFQFPLIKKLCDEAGSELQVILADLYPSQLSSEQQRLQQLEESFKILEKKTLNDISLFEWSLLKEVDLVTERNATRASLREALLELQKPPLMEPNERSIDKEYQRIMFLKKTVESRMRALEVLEQNKGHTEGTNTLDLEHLKKEVLHECDSQMDNISDARISLKNYISTVKQTRKFLRDSEVFLLPLPGSAGVCCEKLEVTQQVLASLEDNIQTYIDQLKGEETLHPYLSLVEVEQLKEAILSQFLVRISTLKAKGFLHLENLTSCAENYRNYTKFNEDISLSVRNTEESLAQVVSQKVNSLADCSEQLAKVVALQEELDCLQKHLEEVVDWCPEQSCRGHRETSMAAVWRRIVTLRHCFQQLTPRLKQIIVEWSDITCSVEKASALLQQVEAELPKPAPLIASTNELHDLQQFWEQYQDRLDCEHNSLSALELRITRLLGIPANVEPAPPAPLCQQLQAMQARYNSVKQTSREGLAFIKLDLEEKEKVQEELQVVWVWLTAADSLLSEMDPSSNTAKLKEIHCQLCIQKALVHRIMERINTKYSEAVPAEIGGQLQEIQKILQQVEVKVQEAIEKSDPVRRIGAKLLETHTGLSSVRQTLEEKSSTVTDAKLTQKLVWDQLDRWHSNVAALETDMRTLESPQEALSLAERLTEVQELYAHLAKQAEHKTTLLSKMQTWLQEHQEMINSSESWMAQTQSWLAAPRTYTTAKCLSDHVQALQTVLKDSTQIRSTLQGFSSVLDEMSQVVDVSALREQLSQADRQVAAVQDSFAAPLSRLQQATSEVEVIESEVREMESNVAEIKSILSSPETLPSPKERRLKVVEQKIHSMRSGIADIQKAKPELHLPEKAEETLTVFSVIEELQKLLLELEKKVPALFIQQLPTPLQVPKTTSQAGSSTEEAEENAQIMIAHVEDDALRLSGATLLTVERATPEQRLSETADSPTRQGAGGEEACQEVGGQEQRVKGGGGGVVWWLWDALLGGSSEQPDAPEKREPSGEESAELASPDDTQDVPGAADERSPEDRSDVESESADERLVNTSSSTANLHKAQQRCVLS